MHAVAGAAQVILFTHSLHTRCPVRAKTSLSIRFPNYNNDINTEITSSFKRLQQITTNYNDDINTENTLIIFINLKFNKDLSQWTLVQYNDH